MAVRQPGQFAIIRTRRKTSWWKPLPKWSDPHPFTISVLVFLFFVTISTAHSILRLSSPQSPPDERTLRFTIKAMPGGSFSPFVHTWQPGLEVLVEGPFGVFTPDLSREQNIFMIAGGFHVSHCTVSVASLI